MIETHGTSTQEVVQALIVRATELGAIPFWVNMDTRYVRRFLKGAKEEQVQGWGKLHKMMMSEMDAFLAIRDSENAMELSDVSKEANGWYSRHYQKPVHFKIRVPKTK